MAKVNKQLKELGLSRKIVTPDYPKGREMTTQEKKFYIDKTKKWKADFKKTGKPLGKKTILYKGNKYTREGILK